MLRECSFFWWLVHYQRNLWGLNGKDTDYELDYEHWRDYIIFPDCVSTKSLKNHWTINWTINIELDYQHWGDYLIFPDCMSTKNLKTQTHIKQKIRSTYHITTQRWALKNKIWYISFHSFFPCICPLVIGRPAIVHCWGRDSVMIKTANEHLLYCVYWG